MTRRLTIFKWRYTLINRGFNRVEADRLIFFKYLVMRGFIKETGDMARV